MKYIGILVALVLLATEAYTGFYVVDQSQYALVFGFGQVQAVATEPGLYMKWPVPIQREMLLDNRIQTTSTTEPEHIVTADRIHILADSIIRWRISDPQQYYVSFEAKEEVARDRIVKAAKTAISEVMAHHTFADTLTGEKGGIPQELTGLLAEKTRDTGIEIVEARLERVNYTDETAATIYEQMKAEKAKVAAGIRAKGEEEAKKIRVEGDRQRVAILNDAEREAGRIRGQGDAEAARIHGQAYREDPEFYKFYRSLQSYRESFKNNNRNVLVLDASSPFFRFLKHRAGEK